VYRPGYGYHKAGITLMEIVPRTNQHFFVPAELETSRNEQLMATLDAINGRYGRGALRLAAEGVTKGWQMRRGNLSPRYTTEWAGVARVSAA
jgi:DNA polymerase V